MGTKAGVASSPGGPQAAAAGAVQPIAFSRRIHAGQYGIDYQYCHSEARRSEYAGILSVTRCMGCHKITAADRTETVARAGYPRRSRGCALERGV